MADPRLGQIERLLMETGRSVRWLADQIGSTHTTLGSIIAGQTKNPRDPHVIDRALEVLADIPKNRKRIATMPKQLRSIPVYTTIMAGEPGYYDADVDYEEIPEWGGEFQRWGRVVQGESMEPILRSGDIVIFEDRQHDSGAVVHAFSAGTDCIKCFRMVNGEPRLVSFNPDGPEFSGKEWNVKGVCVGRIRYGGYRSRSVMEFPGGLTWAMRDDRSLQ